MIFSLNSLTFVFEYNTTNDRIHGGDWHSTENVFYFSSWENKKLYIINVTANLSVNSFIYLDPADIKFVHLLKYFSDTNELIGMKYFNTSIDIFGYNLNNPSIKSTSYNSIIDISFDAINSSFFIIVK